MVHNQCIIDNCWRSVPLPCGRYMAIFQIHLRNLFWTLKVELVCPLNETISGLGQTQHSFFDCLVNIQMVGKFFFWLGVMLLSGLSNLIAPFNIDSTLFVEGFVLLLFKGVLWISFEQHPALTMTKCILKILNTIWMENLSSAAWSAAFQSQKRISQKNEKAGLHLCLCSENSDHWFRKTFCEEMKNIGYKDLIPRHS